MRGRKPVPTALKLLRGNPGKRGVNRLEPKPARLKPDCPPELVDKDARGEWIRSIQPAIVLNQITVADRVLAIAHCELWATWRSQLSEAGRKAHVIAAGKNKHPTQNPARRMANQTLQLLVKVDSELGLTPASRSRITVGGPGDDREETKLSRLLAIQ
jgi:P27 family predicted phage terminase small subunit